MKTIEFNYDIDEWCIHKRTGREVCINNIEIHKYENIYFCVYVCIDSNHFTVKARDIDLIKIEEGEQND